MSGVYVNDASMTFGLARAYFLDAQLTQASEVLTKLRKARPAFKPDGTRLLGARILEARGELESALLEYEELAESAVGLEPKVRYGLLLRQLGYTKQSNMVLEDVLKYAKRFTALETERQWVDMAKAHIIHN
jgi:hypothetical protein